jgi:hypothetical protein
MQKLVTFLVLLLVSTAHADWPQFRGVNSSGYCEAGSLPTEFGPGKNELWNIPLAPGHSSPVVVGDVIFLTTFDKQTKQLKVVCIEETWSITSC